MTPDDLRQLQQRRRAQVVFDDGNVSPSSALPKTVEVPCGVCGEPITIPSPQYGTKLPKNIAHNPACITAYNQHCERERQEEESRALENALAIVRSDLPAALARCGVDSHWLGASFGMCNDLPGRLVDAARRWVAKPAGILYLYGISGSAKTWLAVAMLRHILDAGRLSPSACRYIAERDYLEGLKAAFGDGKGETPPRLLPSNHPRRVPLLLYDDLAAERQTDWTRGEIAKLIESRHADDLPTIITANIAPSDIAKAVDGRVASRIAESGLIWEFPRKDLRVNGSLGATGDAKV